MAAVNVDLPDQLVRVARQVAKRFTGFVDVDDAIQELHVYVLANERMFARWYEKDEKFRIIRALFGAARQFCEREKATKSGYAFDDIAWYDPTRLAALVPLAFNPRWDGLSGEQAEAGVPAGKAVKSESGTLMAMVCDIRRIVSKTKFLVTDFDEDTEQGEKNLAWLCDRLGGPYPSAPGYEPRRKAMSNARAQQVTGENY